MALGFVHPEYNIDFSINITLSDILTHLEKCDIEEDYSYLNWEDTLHVYLKNSNMASDQKDIIKKRYDSDYSEAGGKGW